MGAGALDLELELGRGLGISGAGYGRAGEAWMERSPASSSAHSNHPYGQFSPSVSVSSPLSGGAKEKEKRRPNVLKRRPSTAAAAVQPTSTPALTLPPQPLFSPLSLSPVHPHPNLNIPSSASSSSSTFARGAISGHHDELGPSASAASRSASSFDAHPNSNSGHSHHHHTHGDLSQHRQQHIVPQQNSSKHQHRPAPSPQGLAAQMQSQSQMQRSTSASASLGSSPHDHSPALTTTSTKAVKILQSLNPTRAEMHMAHTHTPPSPHASLRPHQHQLLSSSSRRSSRSQSRSRSRAGSPPRSPIASTLVPGSIAGSGTVTGTATPAPGLNLNPALLGPSQSMSMLSALAPAGDRGREGGRSEKMKDKGREREKERSKATPASSLIEAYKRQEREREELERVARMGEVLDDHVDLDADLEEAPVHVRPRSMDKARRLLGDDVDFTGSWRARSQQPSINHNQGQSRSQPSSFGRSKGRRHSIATSISLLDAYPSLNKDESSQNSSAPAARRNLNVDTSSSFIQRRKAIHSFASMDSGLDLAPRLASDVEEQHLELGSDRVNGFGVIERLVGAHPPSPSPSPNPSPNPSSTRPHQHQSHSQPPTQPHTPEPATPYYTVFGSTSGRVVAVGGREDAAWDAYGLGYWDSGMGGLGRRTTVGAGASGGKEKEKPSLGRSLSRKVSGRWRKHGGVVVGVISDTEKDRSKERGRDRVLPDVPGRSSMQERGKAGSASRREDVEKEEEERQKMRNRRSLRLSIEKFADLDVGVEEDGRFRRLGAGASPEMDVDLNSENDEDVDESKEVELPVPRHVYLKEEPGSSSTVSSPAGGGGRFWKLMKRISVGGGLRDKFLGPSSSAGGTPTDAHPPPVPPLPPNLASLTPPHSQSHHHNQKTEAEAKPKHRLHGSRSTDSSLKFLRNRGATASSKSSSTASSPTPHTDLNSQSKDPSTPLASPNTRKAPPANIPTTTAAATASGTAASSPNLASNHPRRSTTTRSSSPVSSSDVVSASASASTKLFHHAQSSRSSESSFSEENQVVPPLPLPLPVTKSMLAQHIIAPSELRRVGEDDDVSHSRVQHRHQQGAIGMGLGLGMAGMTVRMPSPRDLSEEDWMIVRSPSVELPSLTLPPRRARAAVAPPSTSSNNSAPAASSPLASSSPPSALGGGSPPSLPFWPVRAGEFSVDFDFDRDLEGMSMDRSESPTIPSFSTAGAVNAFPSRRLSSISKSSKAKGSPSTPHPHSAGGIGPVSPSPAALSGSTSATSPTSATPTSSLKHSLSLPTPTSLPPPPRPLRSAHRPGPGVSPAGAQGTLRSASASASLPASSTRGGDAPAPSTSFLPRLQGEGVDAGRAQFQLPQVDINPGADSIPPGRRSESHATTSSSNVVKSLAGFNQHNRRSSGGTSVLTLRPTAGQRRSSSFGAPSVSLSSLAPDSPLEREDSADMWSERGKEIDKDVKKFALTEQEKAAKWADLLERSERAGGTLHIELGMRLGR
ncbi:hypothetical protein GALMADRAFT_232730 [Galerina marginata CBS 339.88]|uniref:Uncharacterized protein n=1 Tax=Galerina marginata (strain CBS 339.88) TaxID=685588 RepID=A0A067SHA2_GALM3|nr:hypothetical protein GALMADRAFT_232730 [Galerina marginata CBS 339.88]